MWLAVTYAVLGLAGVAWGADLFVKGASGMARSLGVSTLVIGLTVVAFGTSAPEFAVALKAALAGKPDLAVGNVVGSNIANVLLILGFTALLAPVSVASRVVRFDTPLVLLASVGVWVLAQDGLIDGWEGRVLFGALVLHTLWTLLASRWDRRRAARAATSASAAALAQSIGEPIAPEAGSVQPDAAASAEAEPAAPTWRQNLLWLGVGLVLLVVGADRLVEGASEIARAFGVSELVIGLTVVAVGTSVPELAASAMAVRRGEADLALGNVLGSNLFNLLCVLGGTAALTPVAVNRAALDVDLPLMVAVALLTWPLIATGKGVGRLKGFGLLVLYAGYLYWQVAVSQGWLDATLGPPIALGALGAAAVLAVLVMAVGKKSRALV